MKGIKLLNLSANKPLSIDTILEMLNTWILIYEDSLMGGNTVLAKKNIEGLIRVARLLSSPFIRTKTNADLLLRRAAEMASVKDGGEKYVEEIGALIYSASEIIRKSV